MKAVFQQGTVGRQFELISRVCSASRLRAHKLLTQTSTWPVARSGTIAAPEASSSQPRGGASFPWGRWKAALREAELKDRQNRVRCRRASLEPGMREGRARGRGRKGEGEAGRQHAAAQFTGSAGRVGMRVEETVAATPGPATWAEECRVVFRDTQRSKVCVSATHRKAGGTEWKGNAQK